MNTKDFLKDIYKDFYGVETPKIEVQKEETKEDSNTFMSNLFEIVTVRNRTNTLKSNIVSFWE